ncbi:MAG: hypothetical protein ABF289_18030 [Clostridiales bacterium]
MKDFNVFEVYMKSGRSFKIKMPDEGNGLIDVHEKLIPRAVDERERIWQCVKDISNNELVFASDEIEAIKYLNYYKEDKGENKDG